MLKMLQDVANPDPNPGPGPGPGPGPYPDPGSVVSAFTRCEGSDFFSWFWFFSWFSFVIVLLQSDIWVAGLEYDGG